MAKCKYSMYERTLPQTQSPRGLTLKGTHAALRIHYHRGYAIDWSSPRKTSAGCGQRSALQRQRTIDAHRIRQAHPSAGGIDGIVLGRVSLTDATDRDVVNLPKCSESSNRPVRSLKLETRKFSAQIDKFRVVFQNGQDQLLSVRKTFEAGSSSRWIDLDGAARCIDKIIIIGDTNTIGRRPGRQATIIFRGK